MSKKQGAFARLERGEITLSQFQELLKAAMLVCCVVLWVSCTISLTKGMQDFRIPGDPKQLLARMSSVGVRPEAVQAIRRLKAQGLKVCRGLAVGGCAMIRAVCRSESSPTIGWTTLTLCRTVSCLRCCTLIMTATEWMCLWSPARWGTGSPTRRSFA